MVRAIKDLCRIRDLLTSGDDKKISNNSYLFVEIIDKLKSALKTSVSNKKYDLDFTAQDLRETADEVRTVLNHWNEILAGDGQTAWLLDMSDKNKGKVDTNTYTEIICPYLRGRFRLVHLLNILDYFSAMLYMTELVNEDDFALKHTKRVRKEQDLINQLEITFLPN